MSKLYYVDEKIKIPNSLVIKNVSRDLTDEDIAIIAKAEKVEHVFEVRKNETKIFMKHGFWDETQKVGDSMSYYSQDEVHRGQYAFSDKFFKCRQINSETDWSMYEDGGRIYILKGECIDYLVSRYSSMVPVGSIMIESCFSLDIVDIVQPEDQSTLEKLQSFDNLNLEIIETIFSELAEIQSLAVENTLTNATDKVNTVDLKTLLINNIDSIKNLLNQI